MATSTRVENSHDDGDDETLQQRQQHLQQGTTIPTEQTPLLANSEVAPTADPVTAEASLSGAAATTTTITNDSTNDKSNTTKETIPKPPFPTRQILLLCFARLVEPIAFFGIFPFINTMIQSLAHIPQSSVGFYSGLIESLFSLTQMLVMIVWGRLSDRFGRKPVLVVSMCGVSVMTGVFGLSRSLWQMMVLRCAAGVFAGSLVTIRTMITEVCLRADEEWRLMKEKEMRNGGGGGEREEEVVEEEAKEQGNSQAKAFSWFMFANNVGIFLGPLLGGALADPASLYGGIFKKSSFWIEYPYALSTFVTGLIGLTATVTVAIWVEETLPAAKKRKEQRKNSTIDGTEPTTNRVDDEHETDSLLHNDNNTPQMSTWELISQPGVIHVLWIYAHVMLLAYSYTAIVTLFWYTSIPLGGFGFTPLQISLFLALTGLAQAIWTLFVFPPLHRRFGTGWILRVCSIFYLLFFVHFPLLSLWLRHADAYDVAWERTAFWVVAPIALALGAGISMSFTGIQLALNDVCPEQNMLGTLNGLALALASGVRAFSPAVFTSLFAVGVKSQILGGYLIWLILLLLVVVYIVLAKKLPEKAAGRPRKPKSSERETENGSA